MLTKEELLALGISEENATKILKAHTDTLTEGFIPKHRFDEVNTELKNSKASLVERDKQIEGLKKFEGDADALKETIKTLEETNKTLDSESKKMLATERKRNAVKMELLQDETGKPHDVDLVMGLFNLDNIVFDETSGKVVSGLKEQKESIKKEKAFLFSTVETQTKKPEGVKFTGTPPVDGVKGQENLDTSTSFGKSLAQIKLGMQGIQPVAANTAAK